MFDIFGAFFTMYLSILILIEMRAPEMATIFGLQTVTYSGYI